VAGRCRAVRCSHCRRAPCFVIVGRSRGGEVSRKRSRGGCCAGDSGVEEMGQEAGAANMGGGERVDFFWVDHARTVPMAEQQQGREWISFVLTRPKLSPWL
jgi:hypothetical protein